MSPRYAFQTPAAVGPWGSRSIRRDVFLRPARNRNRPTGKALFEGRPERKNQANIPFPAVHWAYLAAHGKQAFAYDLLADISCFLSAFPPPPSRAGTFRSTRHFLPSAPNRAAERVCWSKAPCQSQRVLVRLTMPSGLEAFGRPGKQLPHDRKILLWPPSSRFCWEDDGGGARTLKCVVVLILQGGGQGPIRPNR